MKKVICVVMLSLFVLYGTFRTDNWFFVGGVTSSAKEIELVNSHLRPHILYASLMLNFSPHIIDAVIYAESGGDTTAVSYCGAIGPMQLMPLTARHIGVNPRNVAENIYGGSLYLSDLCDLFGGNLELALSAYNAGPDRVMRYSNVLPYTEDYVRKVTKLIRTGACDEKDSEA